MVKTISSSLHCKALEDRIMSAEKAAALIKDGMTLGLSGFTKAGDAKAVPKALIDRAKEESLKLNIYTGASLGSELDAMMAEVGMVNKRIPFQADRRMRRKINEGEVLFVDYHLSQMAESVREEVLERVDVAIIEAIAVKEDGSIVPSTSVGNSTLFAKYADHIIIEINEAQPKALEGIHDIYDIEKYSKERLPIPLTQVDEKIGKTSISIDPSKVLGIVYSKELDSPSSIAPPDEATQTMAKHLIDFLKQEVDAGRLTKELAPLQSGIGTVANAVMYGLLETEFENLVVYSEVLQDAVFDLMKAGKVRFASGCSMTLSEEKMEQVFGRFDKFKDKIVLRPQEISNHPEIIRRLGLISINTALEADLYGNINSTHVAGTHMMNGIGGSGDFARNARLAIFVTKSTAKDGKISSIVPFVSHVDHTEHDVDVLVTEQGFADLRGLAPVERARVIIDRCVHPTYKQQLEKYFVEALSQGGHTPHVLNKAFSWHMHYKNHGTMLKK